MLYIVEFEIISEIINSFFNYGTVRYVVYGHNPVVLAFGLIKVATRF